MTMIYWGQPNQTNVVMPGEPIVTASTVGDLTPPVYVNGPVPDIPLTVDVLMTPVDLSTYFTGAVIYTLTGPIPKNLLWDPKTGIMSGTPIFTGSWKMQVRGHNIDGVAISNVFKVEVT